MYGGLNVINGVTNGKGFGFKADRVSCVPRGSRRVDIKENGFIGVVELKEKELSELSSKTVEQMWLKDLEELEVEYNKFMEATTYPHSATSESTTKVGGGGGGAAKAKKVKAKTKE
jgi:hypothetical protein